MNNMDDDKDEIALLNDILGELREVNTQLARVDERSRMNREAVDNMRENRIEPLETKADTNDVRGRRNSLILGAGLTLLTMFIAATITFGYDLIIL